MNLEEAIAGALSPVDIDELLRDSYIWQAGGTLRYVVDPADLQRFCFPIRPAANERIDLDDIGTRQIGLYEIFYRSGEKPILENAYVEEVRLMLDWFVVNARATYSGVELIDELLRLANYDEQKFKSLLQSRGVKEAIAEKGLRFLLSIGLGIHSYALDRLRDIFQKRLDKEFPSSCGNLVEEFSATYDQLYSGVLRLPIIGELIFQEASAQGLSLRHAEFDARVIDRLFFINEQLEIAFVEGKLDRRQIFLYVSSAARSKIVFRHERVQERLPRVENQPFSFWRSSRQLFALAVRRGMRQDGTEDYPKTIENLQNLKDLLEDIQGTGGYPSFRDRKVCGACWLENERPTDCEWGGVCEAILELRDTFEAKRQKIEDAHLANKLNTYWMLSTFAGKKRERKYGALLGALRELQDPRIGDALVKQALEVQELIALRGSFASDLPEGASNIFAEQLFEDHDAVTASSQFFPRRVRIASDEHREIWDAILRFFDLHAQGEMRLRGAIPDLSVSEAREHVIFAFRSFLQLEATWASEQHWDHELTRCLIYLSFVTKEHEEKAFRMAVENAKKFAVPEREFLYVAIWAGRRCGEFRRTDDVAKEALRRYPDDSRFYHGCQLNRFSWIRTKSHECPYNLADCAKLSQGAIAALLKEEPIDSEMLAANYNNLAFVSAFDDEGDRSAFDLMRARGALRDLKLCLPKESWAPLHPEYLHTEAHVELKEAEYAAAEGDEERAKTKLLWAYQDAKAAMALFPNKQEHQRTIELIEESARQQGIDLLDPIL